MQTTHILSWILSLSFLVLQVKAEPVEDKQALLDLLSGLSPSRSLNWNQTSPVCSTWKGITCSKDESRVIAVRLPGVGFEGQIPSDTISRLSSLRILSLRSNDIHGSFPSDLSRLKSLSHLYLQHNSLSGSLPADFSMWTHLVVLDLSNNKFTGRIPDLISGLTRLKVLNFANNSLSGQIPILNLPNLQRIDLSNNNLTGSIPNSLRKFPETDFSGNNILKQKSRLPFGLDKSAFLLILTPLVISGLSASIFLFIVCCLRKKRSLGFRASEKLQKADSSPEIGFSRSVGSSSKIVLLEGQTYAFDLEDLLRASAEVLGKGTFGTSYKATLEDTNIVVVKRLTNVAAAKSEFEKNMETIGKIKHENVAELKGYYYAKDEKLIVYEYCSQGSLFEILHGNRGEIRGTLDWNTRMRIALGTARGLARIHAENNGRFVHGNIKCSNIFLTSQNFGYVSEHGLTSITTSLPRSTSHLSGYRAPEIRDTRKSTQSSDVYSFGVVLLELLTGKVPVSRKANGESMHLVRWVRLMVREEWTGEVFDMELLKHPDIEEMVEMLQIAMSCVVWDPEKRPKMADLVNLIENVGHNSGQKEN